MNRSQKNSAYVVSVIIITTAVLFILISIPNYLRDPAEDTIVLQPKFIIIFLVADILLIGVLAAFHYLYVKDYSPIKSLWAFAIFGGLLGGLLGERNFLMIIPYTILMLIYAVFYKRFTWWKVAITSLLGGILIENLMNRAPIQAPTLLWIAFFTYPFFFAKIWENRHSIKPLEILKDQRYVFLAAIILLALTKFIVKSIPVVFAILAIILPFLALFIYRLIKKK